MSSLPSDPESAVPAASRGEAALSPPDIIALGSGTRLAARGFHRDDRGGSLVCSVCDACGEHAWPPLPRCHVCWGSVHDESLGRHGMLYAFSILHVGPGGWPTPYAIGYVDMPEGVRVFTHLQGWQAGLQLDMRVVLRQGLPEDRVPFWFEAEGR